MARKDKKMSKAQEKKKERLDLEKKMNARVAIVDEANKTEDHLKELPSFQVYKKDKLSYALTTQPVDKIDESTRDWIMELMITNMKASYEKASWGWKESEKKKELFEDNARYLIAKDEDGKCVAFVHFRFDMDYDDEVLYVYEVQLEKEVRRQGLGRFMMRVLEFLAWRADMRKIMLTVLKHNTEAVEFFKKSLGFEIDETCPIDDVYEQFDYEILSKFNKKKLAREASLENESLAANNAISAPAPCKSACC